MKTQTCDWCGKPRRDVQSVGETSACFLCRQQARFGRGFDEKTNRYVKLEGM